MAISIPPISTHTLKGIPDTFIKWLLALINNIQDAPTGGNVVGPSSASNGNFASFSGTTGKLIRDSSKSSASFDDAGAAAAAQAAAEAYADTQAAAAQSAAEGYTDTKLSYHSGSGSPVGSVVPRFFPFDFYIDTASTGYSTKILWASTGAANTDWQRVNSPYRSWTSVPTAGGGNVTPNWFGEEGMATVAGVKTWWKANSTSAGDWTQIG